MNGEKERSYQIQKKMKVRRGDKKKRIKEKDTHKLENRCPQFA